jgi:cytidine deaminase
MSAEELLAAARAARERAYAPYSTFAVGAALLCEDGSVFSGCNVENASYGLSNCAERTAAFAAVAAGCHRFVAIGIAGPEGASTPPCGACRQVLAEFGPTMTVYFTSGDAYETASLRDLLPAQFELP